MGSPVTFLLLTIPSTPPSNGDVLTWDASIGQWNAHAAPSGSFAAGGDLSGTSSNQTVVGLQGFPVSSSTPSIAQVLTWNGSSWAPADAGSGFTAGGDLSGSSSSQVVIKIHGATVPIAGSLTTGNVLQVTGASTLGYAALNLAGGANYVTGVLPSSNQATQTMGGDVTGTTGSSTVIRLQGLDVSSATPNDGDILTWVAGNNDWEPAVAPIGFSAGGDLSGTATNQTVIGLQNNPVKAEFLNATQDGYVLTWKNTDGYWESSELTYSATNFDHIEITITDITGQWAAVMAIIPLYKSNKIYFDSVSTLVPSGTWNVGAYSEWQCTDNIQVVDFTNATFDNNFPFKLDSIALQCNYSPGKTIFVFSKNSNIELLNNSYIRGTGTNASVPLIDLNGHTSFINLNFAGGLYAQTASPLIDDVNNLGGGLSVTASIAGVITSNVIGANLLSSQNFAISRYDQSSVIDSSYSISSAIDVTLFNTFSISPVLNKSINALSSFSPLSDGIYIFSGTPTSGTFTLNFNGGFGQGRSAILDFTNADMSGITTLTFSSGGLNYNSTIPSVSVIYEVYSDILSNGTANNLKVRILDGNFAGDLSGNVLSQTVIALQNNPVQSGILGSGQDGYILTWTNADGYWEAMPAPVGFTAGGDLSGTATNQNVINIHGASVPIAGSLTIGNGLYVTGASALSYSALNLAGGANYVTGVLPTGNQASQTMSGDVTGTTAASAVVNINGASVPAAGSLTTGTVLQVSGSSALTYATITNANVSATAAIAGSKINPNFGFQLIQTLSGLSVLQSATIGTDTSVNSISGSIAYTAKTFSSSGSIDFITRDNVIFADTSGGPFNLTLPAPTSGRIFYIKDKSQSFATNNLTIVRHGSEKIDGTAASLVLSTVNQEIIILSDGTDWYTSNFSSVPGGSAGGDLSGTYPNPSVVKIQGKTLASSLASIGSSQDGYVLTWVNGSTDWEAQPAPTGFTAGGDLTGTATNQNVVNIHGASVPIAGSLTTGNGLYVTGASALSYSALNLAGGSNYVTGSLPKGNQANQDLAGDVTGNTGASVVAKINGATVSAAGSLTTGNGLYVSGSSALTYSALNLAGGANYVTGNLPISNVAPGTSAQILMSNGTPATTWTTVSGDATIGNTGVTAVAKINGASVPAAGSLTTSTVLQVSGSSALTYALIANANVDAAAAIAGSKISPNFGSQSLTAGTVTLGTTTSANSTVGSISYTTKTFSGTGTIDTTTNDAIIYADTSGGGFNLTLPAPTNGRKIIIKDKKQTFNTNNLTLVRHGSEKIDGVAASLVMSGQNIQYTITSDGTDWYTGTGATGAAGATGQTAQTTKTTDYTVDTSGANTDFIIFCNFSAGHNITLPDPSTRTQPIVISDISGTAQTNNITVVRHGSEKISNLAASYVIVTNFGTLKLASDLTNWWIVQ